MSDKQFNNLMQKLDILIKLTAFNLLKDKNKTEQIMILADLGLERQDIANIVGTTPSTVSVTLSQMKQKKKKTQEKEAQTKEGVTSAENKQENI